MFGMSKSQFGLGLALGMISGAAVISGAVMACPQGRCLARTVVKRGKRLIHSITE